jgi:type I restriction-modification system DNA methylase subunit
MKNILNTVNYKRDFLKLLNNITKSKSPSRIFCDWLTMSASALYSWKKNKNVENEYLQISKSYNKEQLIKLSHLLGIITNALQNEDKDILGLIFTELNIGNKKTGQYFTPQPISNLIAEISFSNKENKDKIITALDPYCGSGVMLLSIAYALKKQRNDYQKYVVLVGQDIDSICCYMTFIQLSLIGVPAIVKCGNSLTNTVDWQRETVWYHVYNMDERLKKQDEKENKTHGNKNLIKKLFQKELF